MNKINMLVKDLAGVASNIAELKEKEKMLKELIVTELVLEDKKDEQTEYGKVTIARRPVYTYTEHIQKLEEHLAMEKVREVEQELADIEYTEYVLFKPVKVK